MKNKEHLSVNKSNYKCRYNNIISNNRWVVRMLLVLVGVLCNNKLTRICSNKSNRFKSKTNSSWLNCNSLWIVNKILLNHLTIRILVPFKNNSINKTQECTVINSNCSIYLQTVNHHIYNKESKIDHQFKEGLDQLWHFKRI